MDNNAAINAQNIFGLASPEYYEPVSKLELDQVFIELLKEMVPPQWNLIRGDIWVHAQSPLDKPPRPQGFKIHVSTTPLHVQRILEIIVPILVNKNIEFKIAGDESILFLLNSKQQSRGSSGKFMTIYPPSEEVFIDVIENLYQNTKNEPFEGPYILSDNRYKESNILFYRYGGINPPDKLTIEGTRDSYLISPDGEHVLDQRLPYFNLPAWVVDPFKKVSQDNDDNSTLLKSRYRIEGVLSFSNSGGVYHGIDTFTNQSVIIKEARPHTNFWRIEDKIWDATYLLKREYKTLVQLESLSFIPDPIDFFQEWEHSFLVEQRVDGIRFDSFWTQEDVILAPYIRDIKSFNTFIPKFREIALRLIAMVQEIHAKNVILGDLSPNNILINNDTLEMYFIDFESGLLPGDDSEIMKYALHWGTPGFMSQNREGQESLKPKDDFYSLAMVLYSCVISVNNIFEINNKPLMFFIDKLVDLGLPIEVSSAITHLMNNEVDKAKEALLQLRVGNTEMLANFHSSKVNENMIKSIASNVENTLERMVEYILSTTDCDRNDRLFPAHYSIFMTNPINVAYGASGTMLFLQEMMEELPDPIWDWVDKQPIDLQFYPPGFFVGLSGIAYTFLRCGQLEKGEEVMDMLYRSELLFEEPSIFLGVAGWGMVSLSYWKRTKKDIYLNMALKAGEHLLETAAYEEGLPYWEYQNDNRVHFGLGYGSSGIAYFLLLLFMETNRTEFKEYAEKALEFDLQQKMESEFGWQWTRYKDDTLLYPYWIHGSSGIGSIVIRFYSILGYEKYKDLACKIADDTFVKYAFIPSTFEGLAGIGEFMLDMYFYSGKTDYYEKAFDIAETILWFKIDTPKGTAYPGRWLTKTSTDYATGSAGIGLFFKRLLNPGPHIILDMY
ncbi:MAG: protein kinase/lanthionine synthetase C family protein [Flavobacteriales bacterium]|nr:protein kinase/lanthionine synthetase C family protein [Flavobacteriales bacterium]